MKYQVLKTYDREALTKDSILTRLWRRIFPPPRKRIDARFVSYAEADKLCREGWTIAPEEDYNKLIGWVHLELLEPRK
jgi:hypothetical protein